MTQQETAAAPEHTPPARKPKKRRLLRFLLIAIPVLTLLGFLFRGCGGFTYTTMHDLGTKRSSLIDPQYRLSPDGREIIFSCVRKTKRDYFPYLSLFERFRVSIIAEVRDEAAEQPRDCTWNTYETIEKRISLDDPPENMVRFYLDTDVVKDPSLMPGKTIFRYDFSTVRPGRVRIDGRDESDPPSSDIWDNVWKPLENEMAIDEGSTIRLQIHPDDLPTLAGPFHLMLEQKDNPYQKKVRILVFPAGKDGDRYVMMTCNTDFPFQEDLKAAIENEQEIGFFGHCWSALWLPGAVVLDTLFVPVYVWALIRWMNIWGNFRMN